MEWRDEAKETVAAVIADRGEDVAYSVNGGAPVTLKGIFEVPPVVVFDGPGIATARPAFTLAEDDLPALAKVDLDTLTVRDTEYHVRVIDRDGIAAVKLTLEEAD